MTRYEELKAIIAGTIPPEPIVQLTKIEKDPRAILLKFVTAFMNYIECPSWNYLKADEPSGVSKEPHIYESDGAFECLVNSEQSAHRYRAKLVDLGNGSTVVIVDAGFGVFPIVAEESIDASMDRLFQMFRRLYHAGAANKAAKAASASAGSGSKS